MAMEIEDEKWDKIGKNGIQEKKFPISRNFHCGMNVYTLPIQARLYEKTTFSTAKTICGKCGKNRLSNSYMPTKKAVGHFGKIWKSKCSFHVSKVSLTLLLCR